MKETKKLIFVITNRSNIILLRFKRRMYFIGGEKKLNEKSSIKSRKNKIKVAFYSFITHNYLSIFIYEYYIND